MNKLISDKSRLIENLYGLSFIVFLVAVFVALLGKHFGSAIWLAIAASNSVSLMFWAKQKKKIEALEKTLAKIESEKS